MGYNSHRKKKFIWILLLSNGKQNESGFLYIFFFLLNAIIHPALIVAK